jgi:hypothetical protein
MPCDYKRDYHPSFRGIAHAAKAAAGWRCQDCGQMCRITGETLEQFKQRIRVYAEEEDAEGLLLAALGDVFADIDAKPQRYTLTTHHPFFDKQNPDAVLEALCSPCHLRKDAKHHAANARRTRQRRRIERGQIALEAVR